MKFKILILLLSISISSSYGQQKFRVSGGQIKELNKIDPNLLPVISIVERTLEKNSNSLLGLDYNIYDPYVSTIKQAFKSNNISEAKIKKIESIICYQCYLDEWNSQKIIAENLASNSSNNFKESDLAKTKVIAVKDAKNDNDAILVSQNENPYDVLQRSLSAFSKSNRFLTVFRNTDYNFSATSLSSYLQLEMGLASKSFNQSNDKITEVFIPKAGFRNERITVTYNFTERKDIKGMYDTETVNLIDSVTITGTPDLLIKLFVKYWPTKLIIGEDEKGQLANKQLLSDLISIDNVNPNEYKISISKGNMEVNYETTYGINKKK